MKTILTLGNGAIVLTEQSGVFTLTLTETVGGGQANGVVSGAGSIKLNASQGIKLAEALLNAHLPVAMQPMAAVVEAVANQAIAALE